MATRYAKAVGGGWNSVNTWSATGSGGADNAGVPTAADDVIFEAGSGNITISGATVCRSLNCTSGTGDYAGTFTINAGTGLTIGTSTAGPGNIAVKFSAAMTFTAGSNTSTITLASTNSTQQTVDLAGKSLGALTFNGVGGSWILGSAIAATSGAINITNGTFDTGNFNITANNWVITTGAAVRTLSLGTSTITLTGTSTIFTASGASNVTITANTAVITHTANARTYHIGSLNWNGTIFEYRATSSSPGSTLTITGSATVGGVRYFAPNNKTSELQITGNTTLTITSEFTIIGTTINRVLVDSVTNGVPVTIICNGTVTVSGADFSDIIASGTANWNLASITGGSGDALGNSGITFTSPTTSYWVGGTGNASDITHWASSSGGTASTGRVPLPQDTLVIDQGSGFAGPTYTFDMPRIGKDFDATARTSTWTIGLAIGITFYGSWLMPNSPTNGISQAVTFSGRGNHFLQTTRTFNTSGTFDAPGGTYTLLANLSAGTGTSFGLAQGTLDLNGFNMTCGSFSSASTTNVRALRNTSSTQSVININSTTATVTIWSVTSTSNFSMGTNIPINITGGTGSGGGTATFIGGGKTYHSLNYINANSARGLLITNSNTFGTLSVLPGSFARTLTLSATTTQTIFNLDVHGTPGNPLSIVSGTPGTRANISIANGTISSDYLTIQDILATGGASFYAGVHSTDSGNNSGWLWADEPFGVDIDESALTNGSLTRSTLTGAIR